MYYSVPVLKNSHYRQLAAVVREMSRLNVIDEELVEDVMYSCSSEGLLQSCAELLRIAPNPRFHPIMEILEVQYNNCHLRFYLNQKVTVLRVWMTCLFHYNDVCYRRKTKRPATRHWSCSAQICMHLTAALKTLMLFIWLQHLVTPRS